MSLDRPIDANTPVSWGKTPTHTCWSDHIFSSLHAHTRMPLRREMVRLWWTQKLSPSITSNHQDCSCTCVCLWVARHNPATKTRNCTKQREQIQTSNYFGEVSEKVLRLDIWNCAPLVCAPPPGKFCTTLNPTIFASCERFLWKWFCQCTSVIVRLCHEMV